MSAIRIKCERCAALTFVGVTPGKSQIVVCSGCGARLVEFTALGGFVYVLSHPNMPGLLKIGSTTRQVEERVAELNAATGVPGPFVIEGVFPSSDPQTHEFAVHRALERARVENREFFKIELPEAIGEIAVTCGPASYLRGSPEGHASVLPFSPSHPWSPPNSQSVRPATPKRSDMSPEEETERLHYWQQRMYNK